MSRSLTLAGRLAVPAVAILCAAGCGGHKSPLPRVSPCSVLRSSEVAAVLDAKTVRAKAVQETAGPACVWASTSPPRAFEITFESKKGETVDVLFIHVAPVLVPPLKCVKLYAGWDQTGAYVKEPTFLLRATSFGDTKTLKQDLCRLLPIVIGRLGKDGKGPKT